MKKFVIYILFATFISACQPVKEGFKLQKKDNSDEFLVEKKNPLVMPPDYTELPTPEDFQSEKKNKVEDEFEEILKNSVNKSVKSNTKKTNIEKSVLDKIN
tara:strand:- start:488 stop:790 length:303 start_codon:yes stop_codon:yes gene_type:complete